MYCITHPIERNNMSAKMTTPKALALELGVDAKVLRSYLRKNHARAKDAKNTSWVIPAAVASAAKKYFAKNVASDTPAEA
jgi:hypothetical protein